MKSYGLLIESNGVIVAHVECKDSCSMVAKSIEYSRKGIDTQMWVVNY